MKSIGYSERQTPYPHKTPNKYWMIINIMRLHRGWVNGLLGVASGNGKKRLAAHALNPRKGAHTTTAEHMPASHRAHLQWTPSKLIAWGERVGAATAAVVRWQMEHRQHPEQGYRSCLGLMRLGSEYGQERLEAACARAQAIRSPSYKSIASILSCGLDQRALDAPLPTQASLPLHENVRGPGYYH